MNKYSLINDQCGRFTPPLTGDVRDEDDTRKHDEAQVEMQEREHMVMDRKTTSVT